MSERDPDSRAACTHHPAASHAPASDPPLEHERPRDPQTYTLRDALHDYRDGPAQVVSDSRDYVRRIDALIGRCEFVDVPIARLHPRHFEQYIKKRRAQVQQTTIARELTIFGSALNRARNYGDARTDGNPIKLARKAMRLTLDVERKRIVKPEEIAPVREMLAAYPNPVPLQLFDFMLMTGARPGSLLDLTWGDVHLDERFALLRKTKNGHEHRLPLGDLAVRYLGRLERGSDDDRVFPVSKSTLRRSWDHKLLASKGIHDLRRYDARATFLTWLGSLERMSVFVFQQFSSHIDVRSCRRYVRPSTKDLADTIDRLSEESGKPAPFLALATTEPPCAELPPLATEHSRSRAARSPVAIPSFLDLPSTGAGARTHETRTRPSVNRQGAQR